MDSNRFDDIIRKAMLDGAEQVPAGLWAGIEGKLGAGTASSGSGLILFLRRWGWAVASAVCACLICAVFLFKGKPVQQESMEETVYVCQSIPRTEAVAESREAARPEIVKPEIIRPEPARPGTTGRETAKPETDELEATEIETAEIETAKPESVGDKGGTHMSETEFKDPYAGGTLFPDVDEIGVPSIKKRRMAFTAALSTGGNAGNSATGAAMHSRSSYNCGTDGKLTETQGTFYMLPIKAGLGVRFGLGRNFAIGTGLNYTFLTRRLKGSYDCGAVESYECDAITNNQHYIGIPLNFYYNFISKDRFTVYAGIGVQIEKCVSNNYRFAIRYDQPDLRGSYPKKISEKVKGLQTGINLGLGIQYNINKLFGLYLDPYACWYIPNYQQPKSIRTVQPFQIGAELGLRFNLQ